MKNYLIIILISCALGAHGQRKDQNQFLIRGHFSHAAKKVVFLEHYYQGKQFLDSAVTDQSGNFSFMGRVAEPHLFHLSFRKVQARVNFFVENTVYNLTGDLNKLDQTLINGGTEQDLYNQYNSKVNEMGKFFLDMQKPLRYVLNQKDTSSYTALINASTIIWRDSLADVQAQFIAAHPSSAVSLYAMKYLVGSVKPVATLDSLMRLIESTPARSYASAKASRELINSRMALSVGGQAPDFLQPDTSGNAVSLTSLSGKYVLLDFWASWCAPCRAENPNVLKVYSQYHDRNFTVLAVSLDESRAAWLKAVEEDNLPWTQVSDLKAHNAAAKIYGVTAIPTNVLIGPDGKIIAVNLRGEALENAVAKIFAGTTN